MYPTHTTFTTGTCRLPALPPAATLPEPVAVYRGTWAPAPAPAEPARAAAPGPAGHPAPAAPAHPAEPARVRTPHPAPAGHPADPEPAAWTPGPRPAPAAPARPAAPAPGAHPAPAAPAHTAEPARARAPHPAAPEAAAWARPPARPASAAPGAYPATAGHPAVLEAAVWAAPARPATPAPGAHPAPAAPAHLAEPARARTPHPAPAAPAPAGHPAPAPHPVVPETAVRDGRGGEAATQPFGATRFGSGVAAAHPARPEPAAAAGCAPAPRAAERADAAPAGIPHPTPEPPSGVPGPGPAEIAARAVARGMRTEEPGPRDGLPRPPRGSGSGSGTAVTEVPLHLPFRPQSQPQPQAPAPAPVARAPKKPPAGRRVPRGDDRLREHRGPVLPGWTAVLVGGLALLGCAAVLWRAGAVPATVVAAFGATPRAYQGLRAAHWPPLALLGIVTLLALGGLGRAKAGHAWVLTLFGRYRGTVRRTGLTWISPLLLRQRVDVRLRHWRSEPMAAVDSGGLALQVVVQVVWQVKDTARATLAVEDHIDYLAEQVESAMARVLSQLPADAFHEDAPTLRDAEAVGDALTRMVAAETEAVGIEVFSAQPTRIEYAPEVAEAMRRRRVAAIDAKHRDTVLTSVVDAVDDTVHRLTSRGIVELDDYERKALVKDLTVAFYTGRSDQ
ncbi:SPFH domain-containing protein [Streptomyces sp. NPDC004126]|uniref:SPFH domain-containing protein n=1 Tax=Streptomyces sp. NPDC004126 TaxID=3390695 RepID=UPI003CFEC797